MSWKYVLVPGLCDTIDHLGEESPVYIGIKRAGEELVRTNATVSEIKLKLDIGDEEGGVMPDDIPRNLAEDVCEALCNFCRSPECRWFSVTLLLNSTIVDMCLLKCAPEEGRMIVPEDNDVMYNSFVAFTSKCHIHNKLQAARGIPMSEDEMGKMVHRWESCAEARPNDAQFCVVFGGWLMMNGFQQDAVEYLEKAIDLDEETCFGAHYTLSVLYENTTPDMEVINQGLGPFQRAQAKHFMESNQRHLQKYLNLAPEEHWQVHRATIQLMLITGVRSAKGTESLPSIENRLPGFCAKQLVLFDRGVKALKLYAKCFGREQSDFKNMYKQCAHMVSIIHHEGLADGASMTQSEYICANPACAKNNEKDGLQKCSRCESVGYCSKTCQTKQ